MHRFPNLVLFGLLLLVIPAAAARADEQRCSSLPDVCSTRIREILSQKTFLGIKVVSGKGGLIIEKVTSDGPGDRFGLREGDRILAINGRDMSHASILDYKRLLDQMRSTPRLVFTVNRSGTIEIRSVRPAHLSKEKIEQAVQAHLREAHANGAEVAGHH
jgi:predicted metalloprotease with PDZ domain